jgi:hypothetical protein
MVHVKGHFADPRVDPVSLAVVYIIVPCAYFVDFVGVLDDE